MIDYVVGQPTKAFFSVLFSLLFVFVCVLSFGGWHGENRNPTESVRDSIDTPMENNL